MTDIPEAPSAMARAEQEVIRVLRDHLTATPPPVVDEDDLRLAAASIVEEVLAAAGKLLAEDDCRRVMQEEFDAQKAVVLAEVARRTDERLEQSAQLVRLAERHLERARISNGAEDLKFTLHRPGYGPAQGTSLEVVPLAELLKLIGGDGD